MRQHNDSGILFNATQLRVNLMKNIFDDMMSLAKKSIDKNSKVSEDVVSQIKVDSTQ